MIQERKKLQLPVIKFKVNTIFIKPALFIAVCLLMARCGVKSGVKAIYNNNCREQTFASVTLKDLSKNTQAYESKLVEVEGFYRSGFEKSALFQSSGSVEEINALWVDFHKVDSLVEATSGANLNTEAELGKIEGKRIKIRGIFNSQNTGHDSQYFAGIQDICYLEIL